MNGEQTVNFGLTSEPASSNLEVGVIYMAEGPDTEVVSSQQDSSSETEDSEKTKAAKAREGNKKAKGKDKGPTKGGASINRKLLEEKWEREFTVEERKNDQVQAAIDAAVRLGHEPDKKTSREGFTEQTAVKVIRNSLSLADNLSRDDEAEFKKLMDRNFKDVPPDSKAEHGLKQIFEAHSERLRKAKELETINLKNEEDFTPRQKYAILKAHYAGLGEKGKDGVKGSAGVFNLTQGQLAERMRILSEKDPKTGKPLFDKNQIRELIEAGITAPMPAPRMVYTDPVFINMRAQISDQLARDILDYSGAKGYEQKVRDHMFAFANNLVIRNEGLTFLTEIIEAEKDLAGPRNEEELKEREFIQKYRHDEMTPGEDVHDLKRDIKSNEQAIWALQDKQRLQGLTNAEKQDLAQKSAALERDKDKLYYRLTDPDQEGFDLDLYSTDTGRVDPELVMILADSDRALDRLVAKIIDPPRAASTSQYQVEFQPGIALALIVGTLKNKSEQTDRPAVPARPGHPALPARDFSYERKIGTRQFQSQTELREAQKFVHEVARIVGEGSSNSEVARAMKARYLVIMEKMKGVGIGRGMYEHMISHAVSTSGHLTDADYDEILSRSKDESGRPLAHQPRSLFKMFERQIQAEVGNPNSPFYKMEGWEIRRAYDACTALHSLTERVSEIAGFGAPPPEQTDRSTPRDFSLRALNPITWDIGRFTIQGDKKFKVLMRLFREHFNKSKLAEGFRTKLGITKVYGGRLITDEIEQNGALGITGGFDSTWREVDVILRPLKVPERTIMGFRITNMANIFDALGSDEMEHFSIPEKAAFLREAFFENGVLRPEFRAAKAIILRRMNSGEGDTHKDYKIAGPIKVNTDRKIGPLNFRDTSVWEVKEQIRTALWERTAEDDTLTMMDFLHNLEYTNGQKIVIFGPGGELERRGINWEDLQYKLLRLSVLKTNAYINGEYKSLQDIIARNPAGVSLTPTEQGFIDYVELKGRQLAPEFANIKFNVNPFMTDVPFQIIDYNTAGEGAFLRRMGSDWDTIKKAMDHFKNEIVSNAFGTKAEKQVENFGAMAKMLEGPFKLAGGQGKIFPMVMAIMSLYEKGGDSREFWRWELMKQIRKSPVGVGILALFHKSNSIAQEYAGPLADAISEDTLQEYGHEMVKNGAITEHDFNRKYKRRFHGLLRMLLFYFRDVFDVVAAVTVASIVKQGFSDTDLKEA